jgi:hypothetical protein
VDIGEHFERLQAAYSRLEEKRAAFQKQVKENSNLSLSLLDMLVLMLMSWDYLESS